MTRSEAGPARAWERHELLIWGKTYPELSTKYTETICTGAVRLDKPGLIRIYPYPERYLEPENKSPKWSVVRAEIRRNLSDSRPESFKVQGPTIEHLRRIAPKRTWSERLSYMLRKEHLFSGLEELSARQIELGTSLGIVKAELLGAALRSVPPSELEESRRKYERITAQRQLWDPGTKPVPALRYKPRIHFRCPGDAQDYTRTVLDWETCMLANQYTGNANRSDLFESALRHNAFTDEHDPYLILGNTQRFPNDFMVVGILYPRKPKAPSLRTDHERQLDLFS